jgi:hypothetical protein
MVQEGNMHESKNSSTSFSFVYKLTEGFLAYLDKTRPGVAKVLREYNVKSAQVVGSVDDFGNLGRYVMTFYGVPFDASEDLDRQAHTEHACIVLDAHPVCLVASRTTEFVPPTEGMSCLIDPAMLQKRMPDKRIGVPIRILRREGYIVTAMTESEGYIFTLDVDELRCWNQLWAKPVITQPATTKV